MLFNTQGLFFMARKEYANKFVNRFFFLFLSHGVSEHGRVREGGDPSWGLGYESMVKRNSSWKAGSSIRCQRPHRLKRAKNVVAKMEDCLIQSK
jgi:hypothetical protein